MKLGDLLGTNAAGSWRDDAPIAGLTADSRAVKPGFLFAALSGSATDGMRFIGDAIARGASAILVGEGVPVESSGGLAVIVDANPRRRLALLAARFHGAQPETIIAPEAGDGASRGAELER